jgi:hypothetical protein
MKRANRAFEIVVYIRYLGIIATNQNVGGWTILKWILERQHGMVWTGSIWLRMRTSGGLL